MYVTGEQTCHKEVCAPNQVCSFSWIRASWSYFITFMQSQLQNTFNSQVNFHSYPSSDCILVWCCWVVQCVLLFHPMDCSPTRLVCPRDFSGKNTGVGYYFLLQGIFLTQGLNPSLLCPLHCRHILYLLKHWGSHISLSRSILLLASMSFIFLIVKNLWHPIIKP